VLEEWPWAGVVNTWYFKRATDEWAKQGKPEAYFRLADPDFTLQPVYQSLKAYISSTVPALYPGTHEPAGWAVQSEGTWTTVDAPDQPFGKYWQAGTAASRLTFTFYGNELALVPACTAEGCAGSLSVTVDDRPAVALLPGDRSGAAGTAVSVARGLSADPHQAIIETINAPAAVAAITIKRSATLWPLWLAGGLAAAVLLVVLARNVARVVRARRSVAAHRSPPAPSEAA
jgi:hypothetical protein